MLKNLVRFKTYGHFFIFHVSPVYAVFSEHRGGSPLAHQRVSVNLRVLLDFYCKLFYMGGIFTPQSVYA